MAPGPSLICYLFLYIKFYRSIALPLVLYIDYGCFHATTAELSSCERNLMADEAEDNLLSDSFQKTIVFSSS